MAESIEALAEQVRAALGDRLTRSGIVGGELTIECAAGDLGEVAGVLCNRPELACRQLVDLAGMDYAGYGEADWETSDMATAAGFSRGVRAGAYRDSQGVERDRFAVVYHLLSHDHNERIRLRVVAPGEPPRVDSVVDIWPAANWFEREAFDLYGILFEGHPDLRRILTDYGFIGHPFRKDFPLSGHVEMRYDPDKQRVVYQPVSIEPRVLVPRVIRHDRRHEGDDAVEAEQTNA